MLLLQPSIYGMTTRPHRASRLVVIISWLGAPRIQTPLAPGKACWECDVLVSDETQRLRDPTTNSAAAPSGGLNALPSKPSALERCQHNVAERQRVLHIARLSLICFSSADSFMFVIKQRMLDVTLRKTELSCWNSRRFHCLTNTTPHLQSLAAEGPVLPN